MFSIMNITILIGKLQLKFKKSMETLGKRKLFEIKLDELRANKEQVYTLNEKTGF